MITKLLCVSALLMTTALSEVQPQVEDLLRQGLFEEEANRDFDKAAERYRAVVAAHDKQRALAATATFRLGEIARKKNDKEAAAAAFRTVAERFPEQENLARMSRENLSALGMALQDKPEQLGPDPFAEGPPDDPEVTEIERLKNIARNSPDLLDGGTDYGWHSMHLAAANGYTKVIAFLLENKADPNSRSTREQLTPLQVAAAHGRLGAINALLAAKARINDEVRFGQDTIKNLPLMDKRADKAEGTWTALDFAVVYDRREVVRALIKAGADMKRVGPVLSGERASTALSLAIHLQREDIALFLVESGVPLDAGGVKDGDTPLMLAIRRMPSLVAALLRSGADANLRGGKPQVAPLHLVAFGGNADRARELVDAGADPKVVNEAGETPLHWAGSREMVEFLVSKGADPNAKDNEGLTPLDAMVMGRIHAEPVPQFEALLAKGAVVTDEDAFIRRTAPDMVQVVRERLIYPKLQREDRVLISVQCSPDSNFVRPMDIRPAPGSPPPSVVEGLGMLRRTGNFVPGIGGIKVIRREGGDRYRTVFEWNPQQGQRNLATDVKFPPLEWGDIVELVLNGQNGSPNSTDFEELIPDRKVVVRFGAVEFPRPLTSSREFWLSDPGNYLPEVRTGNYSIPPPQPVRTQVVNQGDDRSYITQLPLVPGFVERSRITVTRKGVEKPIPVTIGAEDTLPFRVVDGDVIDLVVKDEVREQWSTENKQLLLTTDFKYGGVINKAGLFGSVGMLTSWQHEGAGFDATKVRILRGGDPGKAEQVDFGTLIPENLASLGQQEIAKELAEADALQPGDWILVPPSDSQKSKESVALLNNALSVSQHLSINAQMQGRPIPGQNLQPQRAPRNPVTPPPTPSR